MELHQLRYVVAVARTGNFSRAAAQCHVSQPSLSQQIRKLEEELGERLFDRLKSGARLTPPGEALRERAVRILAEVDAAGREATEWRVLRRGLVTVGVLPTIAPYLLPRVLPGFSRAFPGVGIVVQEDVTTQLVGLLAACALDLAIASLPIHDPRMQTETLFTEELLVALPPRHRLVRKPAIHMADLESERFILMKEGHCLGDQVLDFCTRRDFHPNVLCRSAQIETLRALVQAGMGISLIPATACQERSALQPRYRSLSPPTPRRTVALLWLKERPPGRAARAFIEHLRTTAAAA
ncbi:MAG TPA: LysR family transcriptional regulator [Verrucomicrobiota bacterium]|nr:LysR family transcriptional regulator [Verrucomicrobiota bacterium]HNU50712.1 LysR family transcriptional regulator [Verrucomicrobiota bacterium]